MEALIKRIRFLFTYGSEIDHVMKQVKIAKREEERIKETERQKHQLNLCVKHKQEPNRSNFSSDNCHYCQLLKENDCLQNIIKRNF